MTAKTVLVRVDSTRNRERNTAISRAMTTVTSGARMLRMIELPIETSQGRKRLHRASLSVCMTDRANRTTTATRKLRLMTTDTRRVLIFSGQRRLHRIVFASMTQQTRQSRVIRIVVLKLREVRNSTAGRTT